MLKLTNISTAYGAIPVLRNVSLTVPKGSITCLLGSNGAGKTTVIRTILGLVQPLAGEITFLDQRLNSLPTDEVVKRGIAVVPEGRRVFPKMTVEENLLIGACNIKDKQKIQQGLERVLALFPRLAERRRQNAGTMSGGEQQMLAMARALMSYPKIMLLDEPSLGLAPLLVNEIFKTIGQINQEGITILLIEQNGFKALEMAHQAYLLQKGTVVMECTEADSQAKQKIAEVYLKQHSRGE
ncbi:ABC transporter ATP-binding protein [Sporomusa sp.]|jgi:branched-chain amino acid transport system ATP-binding protein|uniref:ABC transporter ATP-binding protein n=1 Tax=Sporomusa sp. TaxID=2078658 RepID=UPI002BDB9F7C|nr:ABC transporter ATP-binding protein [Sporomusa sp.]MDF2874820.1 livF 6 [Sporomusa sp.]HWR06002.1 ABC transporter ATP-binding protein [Sporomusa sp.]